jgi:2-keto-4-pentenoate hydratase/2-oxohepta-3-ene-1,7-dioic acid hydratase in catechol pathway
MFSLATLRVNGEPIPALCIEGRYWALAEVAPEVLQPRGDRGLMNVFEHWAQAEAILIRVSGMLASDPSRWRALPAPASDDILCPLLYPNKIVLIGANYYAPGQKASGQPPFDKAANIPLFFLKPPTTTLVGSGKSVRLPKQTQEFDYEIELAAIIGKRVRDLSMESALACVAGYTIALDLSARDWLRHPQHRLKSDVFAGKAFDDSCPLGPGIVPARYVDPDDLSLKLWVNGELRQDSHTSEMMWSLAEQLVRITEHVTLEPGDVVSTGTPGGVGMTTQRFLKMGDRVDAEVGLLGRLSVEIRG